MKEIILDEVIKEANSFAPNRAEFILAHRETNKVYYAEKKQRGAEYWEADSLKRGTLQGLIQYLEIIAIRDPKTQRFQPSSLSVGNRPGARVESLLKYQNMGSTPKVVVESPVEKPKEPTPPPVRTKDPVVIAVTKKEYVKIESEVSHPRSAFVSIRTFSSHSKKKNLAVSLNVSGKITISPAMVEELAGRDFDFMISKEEPKVFGIFLGVKSHKPNKSGCYSNTFISSAIDFKNKKTIRIELKYNELLDAYVGNIPV